MVKRAARLGSNIREVLEDVPASLAAEFIQDIFKDVHEEHGLATFSEADPSPDARLPESYLGSLDLEMLALVEHQSRKVAELGSARGAQSLRAIVSKSATHEENENFDRQLDDIARSCWAFVHLQLHFQNAESFHHARQDRDRGNICSAFALDLDEAIPVAADSIDLGALQGKLSQVLELRKNPRLSALDLAASGKHAASVMLIIRHGAELSSVYAHREDGSRQPLYYRPQDEIVLLYTPAERQIEVVGDSFGQRHTVSNAFAEQVLGQNVSERPLSEKVYDLGRFAASFDLEIVDLDNVEVLSAVVTECELLLGSYARRVSLKVTRTDDIDALAKRYLSGALRFRGASGIYRIAISVEYRRTAEERTRSMNITVRGTNGSNVQTHKDRDIRALGASLLKAWCITRDLKPLEPEQAADRLPRLMRLFDLGEEVISGLQLDELGLLTTDLLDAGLIFQKSRQRLTLIDDEDEVVESDVVFFELCESRSARDYTEFKVSTPWLKETLAAILSAELDERRFEPLQDHLLRLGSLKVDGNIVPVFLARHLDKPKVIDSVEEDRQLRATSVPAMILSAGKEAPRYLGHNVVIPVQDVWRTEADCVGLSLERAVERYRADRNMAGNAVRPQIVQNGAHSGSYMMPRKDPLSLTTRIQIDFFSKLVTAYNAGAPDVHASYLLEGTSSRSPREVFSGPKRDKVFGTYVEKSNENGYWCLKD